MCIITICIYNKIVKLKVRADNAWSQVDVQLRTRYDLIPNLVETVKGFATHENEVLTQVTRARASVGSARTQEEAMTANNQLSGALARLLIVSEKYPSLQANTNFLDLQNQLKVLEQKIAMARQFYNDTCMKYNEKISLFPSNIIASIFRFKTRPYFEVDNDIRDNAPKVDFSKKTEPAPAPAPQSEDKAE